MTQEVLKLALEALEANDQLINGTGTNGGLVYCMDGYYSDCFDVDPINKQTDEAIAAIKEALVKEKTLQALHSKNERLGLYKEAYAQPEQEPVAMLERDPSIGRLRVTYEDAVTELDEGIYPLYTKPQGWRDNVAQAYLKGFDEGCKSMLEKNQNDPVAYLTKRKIGGTEGLLRADMVDRSAKNQETHDFIPLYTTPPQRTWVGLAAEDRLTAKYMQDAPDGIEAVIDYIEAKLKERNT